MGGGFVKIHRKIMEWGWFNTPMMLEIFIKIILKANWKDGRFEGRAVKRGQFVASRASMAAYLLISYQSWRTIENHLKSTGELTVESTSEFTVYTVVNYEDYQSNDLDPTNTSTNIPTNDQQTINKRSTTIEEGKERKKVKNKKAPPQPEDALTVLKELILNPAYDHINPEVQLGKIRAWRSIPKNSHRVINRQFLINWCNNIEKPLAVGDGPEPARLTREETAWATKLN